MRDDLHTTVSLRPHWRRAVRLAERADETEATIAIHRASVREWEDGVRPNWFAELAIGIEQAGRDLFGIDSVLAVIDNFERRAGSALENAVCEAARQATYDRPVDKLEGAVRAAVISDCARHGIEHCALSVAGQFGDVQGAELRRVMTKFMSEIDFSSEPAVHSRRKLDKNEMLEVSLELKL